MSRPEVDRKREIAAGALLSRSGVGTVHARWSLSPIYMNWVTEIGLAGSDSEAIVKVALQFAFMNVEAFREFIFNQAETPSYERTFRVGR